MTTARDEVLDRIRQALSADRAEESGAGVLPVSRTYRRAGADVDAEELGRLTDRLANRLRDYRADVVTARATELPARLVEILAHRGIERLAVPDGFPARWIDGFSGQRIGGDPSLDQLGAADGTVSLCAAAIAETGTIVLDGGVGQGVRALSLVPDYLLLVVRGDQVVAGVPDAVAVLDPRRPMTWISGPSATSDIELQRVEGVHGPRMLDVVLIAADS